MFKLTIPNKIVISITLQPKTSNRKQKKKQDKPADNKFFAICHPKYTAQ